MAAAQQVATTRVAISIAMITDRVTIEDISNKCRVTTAPDDALTGTFADLGLDDLRMEFFRDRLSDNCPEIADEIDDPQTFPLRANMEIQIVIETVGALLLASDKWHGQCMPHN